MNRVFHIGDDRGKLIRVSQLLASFLVKPGDDWEIEVRPRRLEKTHEQRKYWHRLLEEFGRAVGHTKNEMKAIVKREILGTHFVTLPSGSRYEIFASSEDEDRIGYSVLIDATLRMAAENGVLLE